MYPIGDIPTADNDFTVSIVPSRTSGIAPLYAFFDAAQSLKASDNDVDMETTYVWNFDTTGAGKGAVTGAWLDLYGRMRDESPDIGAIESMP